MRTALGLQLEQKHVYEVNFKENIALCRPINFEENINVSFYFGYGECTST